MFYILVVNLGILGLSGMFVEGLIIVIVLVVCIGILLMVVMINYFIVLVSGMGLNVFFVFMICMLREIFWEVVLGIVFWNGIFFFLLLFIGVRMKVVEVIFFIFKIGV